MSACLYVCMSVGLTVSLGCVCVCVQAFYAEFGELMMRQPVIGLDFQSYLPIAIVPYMLLLAFSVFNRYAALPPHHAHAVSHTNGWREGGRGGGSILEGQERGFHDGFFPTRGWVGAQGGGEKRAKEPVRNTRALINRLISFGTNPCLTQVTFALDGPAQGSKLEQQLLWCLLQSSQLLTCSNKLKLPDILEPG